MKIKLIAAGNILMGDDAIALYASDRLRSSLEAEGIEVVAGETDIDFCLQAAGDADILFIADACYTGGVPGDVRLFRGIDIPSVICASQHDMGLPALIKHYWSSKTIFLAAIEIESIHGEPQLSSKMKEKLDDICSRLYDTIQGALSLLT